MAKFKVHVGDKPGEFALSKKTKEQIVAETLEHLAKKAGVTVSAFTQGGALEDRLQMVRAKAAHELHRIGIAHSRIATLLGLVNAEAVQAEFDTYRFYELIAKRGGGN